MTQLLKRLRIENQGEGLIEYALLLLLVSMTAVTALGGLASTINNCYIGASTHVEASSHRESLAGESLGFGLKTHTDTPSFSKDQDSMSAR